MASFTILSNGMTYARIRVSGLAAGDIVQVFVRLENDPGDVSFQEWYTATEEKLIVRADGLEPDTDYVVNVALCPYVGSGGDWIGAQYFTTDPEEEPVDPAGFHIYDGGWKKATPYVHNGSRWVQAAPCLYDGGWAEGSGKE